MKTLTIVALVICFISGCLGILSTIIYGYHPFTLNPISIYATPLSMLSVVLLYISEPEVFS